MDCRKFYISELMPSYELMLKYLDNEPPGKGVSLGQVKTVCNKLNDMVDYISNEYPEYIRTKWQANNTKEFRDNLELRNHEFFNIRSDGSFFGYVRDVANVSKHQHIGRPNALINTVKSINESIFIIRHHDRDGYYCSTRSGVTFESLDGSRVPVEVFILLSITSFSNMLIEVGAIPKLPGGGIKKRNFNQSRNEVGKLPKIVMAGNVGEDFKVTFASYIHAPSPVFELRGVKPEDEFNCTTSLMDIVIDRDLFEVE